MSYSYPKTSPYALTLKGSRFVGNYKARRVPKSEDDQIIILAQKYEHRPDLLSYDLYGTPEYWWIFCVRNPNVIRDSIWDFKTGIEIMVPSDDHLRKTIG